MLKIRKGWVALGCAILVAFGAYGVRAQQDTGKKLGEKLDDAAAKVKRGVQDIAEDLRESFARTRTAVHNMGIQSRVYGRLHWDKALNGADLELSSAEEGAITLRGSVPDEAAKAKAVLLARETVGVTRVVDELTIGPAVRTKTTTTTTGPEGSTTTTIEKKTTRKP